MEIVSSPFLSRGRTLERVLVRDLQLGREPPMNHSANICGSWKIRPAVYDDVKNGYSSGQSIDSDEELPRRVEQNQTDYLIRN